MHINPLDIFGATGFHALALILDACIADGACAVIVDFAGHV
ncbi:MAG: hypothetical protein NTY92_05765 [Nitrosospira sp.]|nr:hypothetical protein [Nitrosospira sp.]